jgi:hypothetical protein
VNRKSVCQFRRTPKEGVRVNQKNIQQDQEHQQQTESLLESASLWQRTNKRAESAAGIPSQGPPSTAPMHLGVGFDFPLLGLHSTTMDGLVNRLRRSRNRHGSSQFTTN